MDPDGLRIGNALVGNLDDAAGLEIAQGELTIEFTAATVVAVVGAATVRLEGLDRPTNTTLGVPSGSRLAVSSAAAGRFALVTIRGGIDVAPVLGSRSTYLPTAMGGFNGRRLAAGDRLDCGPDLKAVPSDGTSVTWPSLGDGPIRLAPGPQGHLFGDEAFAALAGTTYRIGAHSDRMGSRLQGQPLAVRMMATLPSEATCLGAIQVPDDGQPIVLLRDGPTVGGYPKIGAVISADLARFAQLPPGASVRFAWSSLDEAERASRLAARWLNATLKTLRSRPPEG